MSEQNDGKGKRPTTAIIDGTPFIQWLIDNIPDLSHFSPSATPHEWEIGVAPILDFVDQKIDELRNRIEPLEDFFENVVKPSHREPLKKAKEETKIEESLKKISELQGEERKKAIRRLITGKEDEE